MAKNKLVRKALTIEDLVQFCKESKLYSFNSQEQGYRISVQVPATFEVDESVDESHRGMMKLKFRIFHTGLNRNGSFVSEESAKDAMPTIKNRPILAAIHQLDNGEWDFEAHNVEIVENEDGEEEINYIEKQVGSFDESEPFFEYDDKEDKTYICGYGYISEEYTKAADIIRSKGGTKNSCELSIDEFSYNAKEGYLSLDKFYLAASTLLGRRKDGTEVQEGMKGSRADIADFSEKNNSVFSHNEKLVEVLEKLNDTLSNFSYTTLKKGGNTLNLFEELLQKYNKTVEDITFEYESLTDEELEAKFAEVFAEDGSDDGDDSGDGSTDTGVDSVSEENGDNTDEGENDELEVEPIVEPEEEPSSEAETNDVPDNTDEADDPAKKNDDEEPKKIQHSVTVNGDTREFAVSLSDIIYSLNTLVNETYEADGTYYSVDVFADEKYVIMVDCWGGRAYKQSYKVKKDSYSLTGDRVEVFSIYVTADERKKLDDMRANYELISDKLAKYEAEPEKMQILESEEYSKIADTDEFIELKKQENHFDLTVEEVSKSADDILLQYAKAGKLEFSAVENGSKITRKKLSAPKKKVKRYGNMFD